MDLFCSGSRINNPMKYITNYSIFQISGKVLTESLDRSEIDDMIKLNKLGIINGSEFIKITQGTHHH
jgi:hypothetical protein